MIDFIRQWVINIVTLVLFIVMFEMLLPTGKMKKYVGLVTGTILIIAIISPLLGLFGKGTDFTALQTLNSNSLNRLQVEKDSKLLKEEQMKQIVEVYRQKIIEEMEQNAEEVEGVKQAKADVIFNEDYNSKTFGEIKRAYLEITPIIKGDGSTSNEGDGSTSLGGDGSSSNEGDGSSKTEAVAKVERVKIGSTPKKQEVDENGDPALKKRLEERISQVFGVKSENIVISQMKR